MSLKFLAVILMTFASTWCVSDVHKACITDYTQAFSNDFLIGTWYHIMKLTTFGGMIPTTKCPTYTYSRPNTTQLNKYKNKYLRDDAPYSFEDNPIHENPGNFDVEGLLMGKNQAKFFIWNPASVMRTPDYDVRVYQRINDDYVLMHDCQLRGFVMWIVSRKRNPPDDELEAIIAGNPVTARMETSRYCAIY